MKLKIYVDETQRTGPLRVNEVTTVNWNVAPRIGETIQYKGDLFTVVVVCHDLDEGKIELRVERA